jgi:hypothetical protein
MHTWRRRKETLGVFGEFAKRQKSVYISFNNNTNFYFLKILFIYSIWNGISQKTISRSCPFEKVYEFGLCRREGRPLSQLVCV